MIQSSATVSNDRKELEKKSGKKVVTTENYKALTENRRRKLGK